MLTHGHQDDILPLDETKYGVDKLKGAGLDIDWIEMEKDHSLEEEEYPIIRQWVQSKLADLQR